MDFVIAPPPAAVVPVVGRDAQFPVRRVYCVGRNYAAHAREMGSDPTREPPFFFCKPADAVVPVLQGATLDLPYPQATGNLHYEIELGGHRQGGADIPVADALSHVWGYGAGLDMTRRDLQFALRDKGRPWELGKAFDRAAPDFPLVPATVVGHPGKGRGVAEREWVAVNGEMCRT
jgi:fumarylpyruvate hydrolase